MFIWLLHDMTTVEAAAADPISFVNWMVEQGLAFVDDTPFIDTYDEKIKGWTPWSMIQVAEYFNVFPEEALMKLLLHDYVDDIFEWEYWVEKVELIK